jgi:hypothetical protein
MLDPDRARLDAGHARGTRPQDLIGDQRLVAVAVIQAVAQIEDQLAWSKWGAGRGGRTHRRAAAALGARVRVEHLLPVEVGLRGDAHAAFGGRVERGDRCRGHMRDRERPSDVARRQLREEQVRNRRDDVKVLGQRQ